MVQRASDSSDHTADSIVMSEEPSSPATSTPRSKPSIEHDECSGSGTGSKDKKWALTSSITDKMRVNRRRIAQGLLQSLGRATPSDDTFYLHYRNRFEEMLANLRSVRDHVANFKSTSSQYTRVCSQMGNSVVMMIDPEDIGKDTDNERFSHAMTTLDSTKYMKNDYLTIEGALSSAIDSINKKIGKMESYKKQLANREKLKLDYDGYDRKLKALQQSKRSEPLRIQEKEMKKHAAHAALMTATDELLRIFAFFDAQRDSMLSPELDVVRETQQFFYRTGVEATEFALRKLAIREGEIETRAARIYEKMRANSQIAQEFEEDNNQEYHENPDTDTPASPSSDDEKKQPKARPARPKLRAPAPMRAGTMKFLTHTTRRTSGESSHGGGNADKCETACAALNENENENEKFISLPRNSFSPTKERSMKNASRERHDVETDEFREPEQSTPPKIYIEGSDLPPPPPDTC